VEKIVQEIAGKGAYVQWFDKMIQLSQVSTHTGQYDGFGVLARSAFLGTLFFILRICFRGLLQPLQFSLKLL
jgi:hypothetical protein